MAGSDQPQSNPPGGHGADLLGWSLAPPECISESGQELRNKAVLRMDVGSE